MAHVHAEYIKETPRFLHLDMQITASSAKKNTYLYGPYTLQKGNAGGTTNQTKGGPKKPKPDSGKVVADISGKVQEQKSNQTQPKSDKTGAIYQYRTKNGGTSSGRTLAQVRKYILGILNDNKQKGELTDKDRFDQCKALVSSIVDLNQQVTPKLTPELLHVECDLIAKVNKFGGETEEEEDDGAEGEDGGEDDGVEGDEQGEDEDGDEVEGDEQGEDEDGGEDDEEDDEEEKEGDDEVTSENKDPTATDPIEPKKSAKTKTKTKTKKAKGADTEAEGGAEKTKVMVHIDCWFYTGPVTYGTEKVAIENMIKAAAIEEGVLESEKEAEVRATTATITGSALCISSSLLSPTPTSETPLTVGPGGPGGPAGDDHTPGDGAHIHGFGAKKTKTDVVVVDFGDFKDGSCLVEYIQKRVPDTVKDAKVVEHTVVEAVAEAFGAGEADVTIGADETGVAGGHAITSITDTGDVDGSVDPAKNSEGDTRSTNKKKVWIFYTVKTTGPVKDTGKNKKRNTEDPLNDTTISSKHGTKLALRTYVPEVLTKNIVLDAMVDLVSRCVEDPLDYDTASRVVQTIMLSDIHYVRAKQDPSASLVSMDKPKPPRKQDKHDTQPKDPAAPATPATRAGFGNNMETLISLIRAALYSTQDNETKLNSAGHIVYKLYDIQLCTKVMFRLSDFDTAVAQESTDDRTKRAKTLKVSDEDPVAIKAVDRSDPSYGVMVYPAVDANYMVVVTKKNTGKPKASIFRFKDNPPVLTDTAARELASQIVNNDGSVSLDNDTSEPDSDAIALKPTKQKSALDLIIEAWVRSIKPIPATEKKKAKAKATVHAIEAVTDINNAPAKIRAIRILLARCVDGPQGQYKSILTSAFSALNDAIRARDAVDDDVASPQDGIRLLDNMFLEFTVDHEFLWPQEKEPQKNEVSALLGIYEYESTSDKAGWWWHGWMSISRIVAQYTAKHNLDVSDFGLERETRIGDILTPTKPKKGTELVYSLLNGLTTQNFGALFTSQPNWASKPIDADNYKSGYTGNKPSCEGGGNAGKIPLNQNEGTLQLLGNGESIKDAISLVKKLIEVKVLVKREHKLMYSLDFDTGLSELDKRLSRIKLNKDLYAINKFTSGSAGDSTAYLNMLKQSIQCFCAFLPMIEHDLRLNKDATNKDEIRVRALSYGCVSHGLDPAHLIALRYAIIKDKKEWSKVHEFNKNLANSLFENKADMPLTTELMRTRILGSVVRFEVTLRTLKQEQKNEMLESDGAESFGRSSLSRKRASMFI
jgi:hypothetical protein